MISYILAGSAAGLVTGLFGTGGGMVLVPLLTLLKNAGQNSPSAAQNGPSATESTPFATSVAIILPLCLTALFVEPPRNLSAGQLLPFLLGSVIGGVLSGFWGQKIPVKWLHRGLGLLILWGGCRYLW